MRHEQNAAPASGAGYERLLNRLKADTRTDLREPSSFAPKNAAVEEADSRAQFGKRRDFKA